ncbi:unnamed protein product, partial [Phaeothamnion confervicola]
MSPRTTLSSSCSRASPCCSRCRRHRCWLRVPRAGCAAAAAAARTATGVGAFGNFGNAAGLHAASLGLMRQSPSPHLLPRSLSEYMMARMLQLVEGLSSYRRYSTTGGGGVCRSGGDQADDAATAAAAGSAGDEEDEDNVARGRGGTTTALPPPHALYDHDGSFSMQTGGSGGGAGLSRRSTLATFGTVHNEGAVRKHRRDPSATSETSGNSQASLALAAAVVAAGSTAAAGTASSVSAGISATAMPAAAIASGLSPRLSPSLMRGSAGSAASMRSSGSSGAVGCGAGALLRPPTGRSPAVHGAAPQHLARTADGTANEGGGGSEDDVSTAAVAVVASAAAGMPHPPLQRPPSALTVPPALQAPPPLPPALLLGRSGSDQTGGGGGGGSGHRRSSADERRVEMTPLGRVPGTRVARYLGSVSLHFIKESWSAAAGGGGVAGFFQVFMTEVNAVVRAHVAALGGNAMLSYRLRPQESGGKTSKNVLYNMITVSGDAAVIEPDGSLPDAMAGDCRLRHVQWRHERHVPGGAAGGGGGGGGGGGAGRGSAAHIGSGGRQGSPQGFAARARAGSMQSRAWAS